MLVLTLTLAADDLERIFAEQLSKGRVFLPGAVAPNERTACALMLEVAGSSHRLAAEIVFVRVVDPGRGVGLQLSALDPAATEALRAFVDSAKISSVDDVDREQPDEERGRPPDALALSAQERIRSLGSVEQQRLASGGTLAERVALERMFGPNVWDTLLRNPRITPPEVMRIARKGTLPRPLIETIAANAAWLASPEVQRALLANPRTSLAIATRILHAMSRGDLVRVEQQTAYPASVRQAAKKLRGA